jgi:hypothetical protein
MIIINFVDLLIEYKLCKAEEEFKTINVASNTESFLELQPKATTTLRYPIQVPFKGDVEIRLCGPEGDY